MKISKDCVVSIHYTLTNDDGEKLDASQPEQPLAYLHGADNIIPGLEQALEGKAPGDAVEAVVEAKDAYGEVNQDLIQEIPRSAVAGIDNLEVGMMLQAQGPDGQVQPLTVEAIAEETVTVNANHQLAGERLHFDVTVDSVRDATAEEIEHGHAH